MSRTAKNRTPGAPKPVEKVTVSTRYLGLRIAAVILLLVIGGVALSNGFTALFSADPGWTEITAQGSGGPTLAGNFTLLYEVGGNAFGASSEKKAVTRAYTQAAEKAWQLFNNDVILEDIVNLRYLNDHPNETVTVEPGLYAALRTAVENGGRQIYLAPMARTYDNLFYCEDDAMTADFDPLLNESLRQSFAELAAFARDESAVSIQLLENNQVRLRVSEAYLACAAREEIADFVDFHWLLNAFAADYIADRLAEAGYTRGTLSSFDGFARTLDSRPESAYTLNLYAAAPGGAQIVGEAQYTGPMSLVTLRSFPLNPSEAGYYVRRDGQIRSRYLSPADGLNHAAPGMLVVYGRDASCADLALRAAEAYTAPAWDAAPLTAWQADGIQALYAADHTVCCTDPALPLTLAEGWRAESLVFQE